jgi:hypothetical protein
MATTFTRVSDSDAKAGEATEITLNDLGFFSLSAVKTAAENLKLIGWRTGDTVSRLDDSGDQAGFVSEIAMTRNLNRTVTAVRTGSETLKLISWSDGSTLNRITRLKDSGDQEVADLIAIQPVGSASSADLVTACRTQGILKLISWNLQSADGAFTRLGDSGNQGNRDAGLNLIALTVHDNVVVTAVRTREGNLKLISWGISPDGAITRLGDSANQGGAVREIAMAGSVTAVRTREGNLKLINWGISPNGAITRLGDSGDHGPASKIAISRFSASRYVTAVRAGNGSLRLIAFDVNPLGAVTFTGNSRPNQAGAVSEVALVTPPQNRLVTAVRDGAGNLLVINWIMQDGVNDALVEELKTQNQFLREQLDAERKANRENRRIIAGLVQRLPELEPAASSEPRESPESATEDDGR